ncbi:hypothetical protein [Tessaracoccus defluvii]|uniref:Uncharacterized protein n=1 Tax=Tessaracoccus defluvii TaxID=1285901 RepID=A0A7H0H5D2_9ACTN|nr:hypothetical protein [Tessaracoccus defluvii]QNP55748.1 hypothetical protein H9L22_16655 [Tessaracoccus defluvii]
MTDRDIYIAHWNRLWLLHYDNAPWVHLEEGWIDEAVELVQIVYRMDGVPGRHGLRRQHPLPDPTEDADSFWEGQAYQDVWDILEPHDIDDTVTSGGIRWYGHVTEDDNLDARGRPFPLAPPPENASY